MTANILPVRQKKLSLLLKCILQKTHFLHQNDFESKLITAFSKLNEEGQQKAIERVEELTEIPKYKKEPPQD